MNSWDWSAVADFMPRFWDGLLTTLRILVLGSVLSFALGLVWALGYRVKTRFVRWPVNFITEFIRNTPCWCSCSSSSSCFPSGASSSPR